MRTAVVRNKGELTESKQRKYIRMGVLWHNEELNKMATKYVHNNSSVQHDHIRLLQVGQQNIAPWSHS